MGGLGNQMFQYALYKKLSKTGKNVKIDISSYNNYQKHNGYELESVFCIKPPICSISEAMHYIKTYEKRKRSKNIISRIIRKCEKLLANQSIMLPGFIRQDDVKYFPNILKMKKGYLSGYWQSEKYFQGAEEDVIEDFAFNINDLDEKNKRIAKEIIDVNSVSVHIRRGDYYSDPEAYRIHGDICTEKYYQKALQKIKELTDNPIYYVFSDDPQWVKKNLDIRDARFIDWNTSNSSSIDMKLMSLCKHNIIANSSFSWWAAYLNRNIKKIVIAPDRWNNRRNKDQYDIVPANWIKIET